MQDKRSTSWNDDAENEKKIPDRKRKSETDTVPNTESKRHKIATQL